MPPRTVPTEDVPEVLPPEDQIPPEESDPPFDEWFLESLEDGYFDWDDEEEKANVLRYFGTCAHPLLTLHPWYYDDERWHCGCCDGYTEKIAMVEYDEKIVASWTRREEDCEDPTCVLYVPAADGSDFVPPEDDLIGEPPGWFTQFPIEYEGTNWYKV
jgi:hypothetical protein